MKQADLFGAKQARDEAMTTVEVNAGASWFAQILSFIRKLPPGLKFTGEGLRLMAIAAMCPEPHHHNAWGAVVMRAQQKGLIARTGRLEHMKTKKSHARLTPVYRKLGGHDG